MIAWLKIGSTPETEYWLADASRAHLTTDINFRRLAAVGVIRSQGSVGGGGENANVPVTLGNGDGRMSAHFAVPPLKQPAQILAVSDGAVVELFSGLVSRVALGPVVTITLES